MKKLKELGMKESSLAWFASPTDLKLAPHSIENPSSTNYIVGNHPTTCYDAPLWQQAIDWLRENHKIDISIMPFPPGITGNHGYEYKMYSHYKYIGGASYLIKKKGLLKTEIEVNKYEQAREAAILKALELINNNT